LSLASPGWLGIVLGDGEDGGVRVRTVIADSPADRIGLRGADRVLAVNGAPVASPAELVAAVQAVEAGGSVTLSVQRGSRTLEIDATVRERPEGGAMRPVAGWLGVEGIALPPALRAHFGAPEEAGFMVAAVAEGAPAEAAGLRIGDVVHEADGRPVQSAGQLARVATEAGVGNRIEIHVARDGLPLVLEAVVARRVDEER
jgi:S1-C subfamily serine protease